MTKKKYLLICTTIITLGAIGWPITFTSKDSINKGQLAQYILSDITTINPLQGILFLGSSSIRRWKTLKEDMAPIPVIQRGYGFAKLKDINKYLWSMASRYRPKGIVLFAGVNDLFVEPSSYPEQVGAEFALFTQSILQALPNTCIFFIEITQTPKFDYLTDHINRTNKIIKDFSLMKNQVHFIETKHLFQKINNNYQYVLFDDDEIHLSAKGYALWKQIIKETLIQSECMNKEKKT